MQGFSNAAAEEAPWVPPTGTLGALTKASELRASHVAHALERLKAVGADLPLPASFQAALRRDTVQLIAEIKRSSPSKGAIAPGLDAVAQARSYESGGAAAVSVLTEPERFGGSLADLDDVSEAIAIPTLRKDFIVHAAQIWEARVNGASAVLLIARALSPDQLPDLLGEATAAGLTALVEVRNAGELSRAMAAGARVIGVNNRDLETLIIDTSTAPSLIAQIPSDIVAIAESGMRGLSDVLAAVATGADAVLIGSALSASSSPAASLRALTNVARVARGNAT